MQIWTHLWCKLCWVRIEKKNSIDSLQVLGILNQVAKFQLRFVLHKDHRTASDDTDR